MFCFKFKHKIWGKTTYSPREGTETNKCSYTWNTPICIRAYLPCEGTETCIASHSSFSIWILGIRTYLPREGTETHWLFSFWFNRFNCIRTYLPRQGTETHFFCRFCDKAISSIRTYLPREGTGTTLLA